MTLQEAIHAARSGIRQGWWSPSIEALRLLADAAESTLPTAPPVLAMGDGPLHLLPGGFVAASSTWLDPKSGDLAHGRYGEPDALLQYCRRADRTVTGGLRESGPTDG
jgi:hypothetical protein